MAEPRRAPPKLEGRRGPDGRLPRNAAPRAAKFPARRAVFLVSAGIAAVLCSIGFAAKALTSEKASANGADPGRIAAGLATGGIFAAGLGAPALKRQSQAREALARFAKSGALALAGPDEAVGTVGDLPVAVRIAYGRGPYASRGASELVVVVRPGSVESTWLGDSEPFDDVDVIERHIERLVARAVRKATPAEEA